MNLLDPLKEWLFSKAIKKAVITVAQAVASYAIGHQLEGWGISFNVDPNALAAALLGASEIARNWLKQHGVKWL